MVDEPLPNNAGDVLLDHPYVPAEIRIRVLDYESALQHARAKEQAIYKDGETILVLNKNKILDTKQYEVEFLNVII